MAKILMLAMVINLLPGMTLPAHAAYPDPYPATVNTERLLSLHEMSGIDLTGLNTFGFTQPVSTSDHLGHLYYNTLDDLHYFASHDEVDLVISDGTEQLRFLADQGGTYTFDLIIGGISLVDGNYYEQSQRTITVEVAGGNVAPTFVGGTTSLTVNQNAGATDIKDLLHASDSDTGQTLTWSQNTAPGHGTLNFDSATESSDSDNITPGGTITYTPAAGYYGPDSFKVQVSDGNGGTATRTISVTINSLPTQTTPTFSPAAGAVAFGTEVTITSAGAEHIYYTTNGSDPGTTVSGATLEYNAGAKPVINSSPVTIKAIAVRTNYNNSAIDSAGYTQAAATAPGAVTLAAGGTNPVGGVTNVAIPAAGATNATGAVTGWVSGAHDKIKFSVTDSGSATSGVTINGAGYTSGTDYTISAAGNLSIVVTTSEAGKANAVRTFTVSVTAAPAQATPSFSPAAGEVALGTEVTITSAGAEHIYYTTNGSDPGTTVSGATQEYNAGAKPVINSSPLTIKAIAVKDGLTNSAIGSASYTQAAATAPSAITLAAGGTNPVGGVTNVAIPAAGATDTTGAVTGWVSGTHDKIKFSVTDSGSATSAITINDVDYTGGTDYTIGAAGNLTIVITTTEAGKANAVRTFTVSVTAAPAQATPSFSPAAGEAALGTEVAITSAGAEHIYYTTNGSEPGTTVSGATQEYNAGAKPVINSSPLTIKAIAVKDGLTNSAIGSASYTQAAATAPSAITLAAGGTNPVGGVTNVAIPAAGATDTTGAVTGWVSGTHDKIKFSVTDSGSATSAITINDVDYTGGTDYTIGAAGNLTIVITTTEAGKANAVRTFTVSVTAAPAQATPSFSPAAGEAALGTEVAITSAGAEHIYYTTNGSEPGTAVSGGTLEYNAGAKPVINSSPLTIKAIAVKDGLTNSAIGSASYTQAAATAPGAVTLAAGGTNPVGGVTNVAIPAAGATNATGAVTGWVSGTHDKIKFSVTDSGSAASGVTINGAGYTSGTDYTISAAGNLSIVVTTSEAGKANAIRTFTVSVTAAPAQATPTFSPAAGEVVFGTEVAITSAGADAIYYTTDGTNPAASAGGATLLYDSGHKPVINSSPLTIKAIAVKDGLTNSAIGSAAYTQEPSADLTDIAVSGTPANYTFAAGTYIYNGITVANGVTSITITPSGTGTITVDGTTVASGVASGAISLNEDVEKTITVIATESGKSAKTYVLKVTRAVSASSGGDGGGGSSTTPAASTPNTITGEVIDGKTGEEVKGIEAKVTTAANGTAVVEVKSQEAILFKQPDGTQSPVSDLSKLGFSSVTNQDAGITMKTDGTIEISNLADATESQFAVTFDLGNGQIITIGTIEVKVGSNGQVSSVTSTLIDPYGIICDSTTGQTIASVHVTLYYADTARNKKNSKTADTRVDLPILDGFKPNNNKNPQESNQEGAYAFMVFPTSDYYLIATKDGYETYKSMIISVEQDIVKWNFKMNKALTGIQRLAGESRVDTALAIAKANYTAQLQNVVLATASNYPDALAGSVLSYKLNAPILLVGSTEAEQKKILDYLKTNLDSAGTVYILGGTGVVGQGIENKISEAGFGKITRVSGQNRSETALKIADQLEVPTGRPLILVNETNYADALSISSSAAAAQSPILLVEKDGFSAAVRQKITDIKPIKVYLIGGEGVISSKVSHQVREITGLNEDNIIRLGGEDRYATSLAVAKYFNLSGQSTCLATGKNFPDALAGSVYAANYNAPIILVDDNIPDETKEYLKTRNMTGAVIFGGEGVMGKKIEQELSELLLNN
ncbi:MAG: cell wall-binding repeat-containing protein [Desulfitobacterium sp.]